MQVSSCLVPSYHLIPERREGQIIWKKLESNSGPPALQAAPLSIMPLPLEQPIFLFDQLDSWNFDKLCVDHWIDLLAKNFFDFPGSDHRPEEGVDGRDVERASERLGHHGRGASRETFLSDNHSLQQSTFNFNKPLSWTWFSLQLVCCPDPSWR